MFTEGALLLERVAGDAARRARADAQGDRRRASTAAATPTAARRGPARRAAVPRARRRCSPRHPLRELVTVEGPYPLYADRQRALFGAWYEFFPRSEGATSTPKTGKVVSGTFRTAAEAARRRRRDGLRRHLPAADPPDRRGQPQGPQQHPRPRPGRPRLAVGDRLARTAATTRSTPTSARSRTSTRSSRGPSELGLEVALDLALQSAPDHPWVTSAPGVVHHPGRRHDRLRREPAEEVPGHLPAQLRQRPRGHLRARCCGSSGSGCRTACGSSASTTRTPSRWRSGSGCSREVRAHRPRRALPRRGVHPAGDDAGLGAVGFHQCYTYFTWRTAKWEIEDYLARGRPTRPTT